MERRTFEDSFRDAFRDAEATPSAEVWTNIELELEKGSGSDMRKRLAFYQMLAAAAVVLAMLASGVAYFIVNEKNETIERMLVEARPNENNVPATRSDGSGTSSYPNGSSNPGELARAGADEQTISITGQSNPLAGSTGTPGEQRNNSSSLSGIASSSNPAASGAIQQSGTSNTYNTSGNLNGARSLSRSTNGINRSEGVTQTDAANAGYRTGNALSPGGSSVLSGNEVAARALPPFYQATIDEPSFDHKKESTVDPVALMLSKLAEQEMKLAANDEKPKSEREEKVWTALGVAAGGFSAVNHGSASSQSFAMALSNTTVPDKQSKASGVAYSLGLSFGTKVAPRWIVHGGVNYLTQSSNYTATNVIAGPNYSSLQAESINALGKLPAVADAAFAAERLAPTVPYTVNNNLKFFSVPVQAGYLVVDRKFGIQLNAGISTDLFLENTLTPEGGSLDKQTQSNGSDSPYRTVNFSGLMGTEFTYRLGERYRIALNPALRYPLNSVYKSEVGIESTPLTFDVGLRFRYIFK